jgi:superfamily II DNA helicase RecQ
MKYKFFIVPVIGGEEAEAELNKFLIENKIAALERKFVEDGAGSLWALCVSYIENAALKPSTTQKKPNVDYREVLSEEDFAVFARLRSLRKELAERDGVPPYAVFTNEQLAGLVQRRVRTKAAMGEIAGIGDARIEKYAARFLAVLSSELPDHELSPKREQDAHNGAA